MMINRRKLPACRPKTRTNLEACSALGPRLCAGASVAPNIPARAKMQSFCGEREDSVPLSGRLGGKLHASRSEEAARLLQPAGCAQQGVRIRKFAFFILNERPCLS